MKKIVVMGYIGLHNYGDNFIADSVKYLINSVSDCEVVEADLESDMSFVTKLFYYPFLVLSKFRKQSVLAAKFLNLAVKIRCKKTYRKLLKDCDALIFGGGGFKYGTQKVWAYYSLGVEIAQEYGIPVMFDAMNIQKYNGNDWKCRYLQEHANRPNVKMITTRDGEFGVERLVNDYKIRKDIICAGVGDPAFWIPECYGINKASREVVGINLIHAKAFVRYGRNVSEEAMYDAYLGVLKGLDEAGIKWELFTNGMPEDYAFGQKVLKLYGDENHVIKHAKSVEDLLLIVASYKVVFGARLHAGICAYALDIPVVGFCWDEKLDCFAKMAGIESYFLSENDFSSDNLLPLIVNNFNHPIVYDKENRDYWREETKKYLSAFIDMLGE
ncbi:MAG: polysaccharide pyruvyl transferase family protein [Lachnospiraceae bacterium]